MNRYTPGDGECVRILRAALAADAPAVRCTAARALGDLALLYGPAKLDAHLSDAATSSPVDDGDADVAAAAAAPLEQALLAAMDEPAFGFDGDKVGLYRLNAADP